MDKITVTTSPTESDPNGFAPDTPGAKLDKGKVQAGLLIDFALALSQVALVADFGAAKYSKGGWQEVPNGKDRYYNAFWRHLLAARHEAFDPNSELPHLSHALWNLMAVVELDHREKLLEEF